MYNLSTSSPSNRTLIASASLFSIKTQTEWFKKWVNTIYKYCENTYSCIHVYMYVHSYMRMGRIEPVWGTNIRLRYNADRMGQQTKKQFGIIFIIAVNNNEFKNDNKVYNFNWNILSINMFKKRKLMKQLTGSKRTYIFNLKLLYFRFKLFRELHTNHKSFLCRI